MKERDKVFIIFRILAVFFVCASIFMAYRFLFRDNVYEFDLKFMEENKDSYVINCFNLRQGNFELALEYVSDEDTAATVQADNDKAFDIAMPAGETVASTSFSLLHPTDRFKITIPAAGDSMVINAVRLTSGRIPIYLDSLLYAFLYFAAGILILVFGKKAESLSAQDKYTVLAIIIMIVLVNIPYYQKALGFTADIRAHMQRIEGIMRGLMDRQFPVIISPNMMNEFGEMSFLYPDIFLYPFGIMRIFGVSMLTAYRLCMLCVNAATVIIAYLSFRLLSSDRVIVLTATFVITFEPYRLYNMLGRGSGAGNAIASAFLPLVIAGIYLILKGDKRWWVLSLGITGVMESHVLTLVLLIVSLLLIGLVFVHELIRNGKYKLLIRAVVLTLVMNLGFIIIFLKCYMTDWSSAALEWSDFADSAFDAASALLSPWSLFEIVALVLCIVYLIRAKAGMDTGKRFALTLTILGGLMYVTTLKLFPWRSLTAASPALDRFTTMLQVPQRIYALSSVFFICGLVILISDLGLISARISDEKNKAGILALPVSVVCVLMGAVLIYGTVDAFVDYYSASPLMPDEVYGDHNSLPIKDYIPTGVTDESWAKDAGYVSDDEAVESVAYIKDGTHIDYSYIAYTDNAYAVMPLLYYEWYKGHDEAGKPLNVVKSEDGRVMVGLVGDGEIHETHIYFDIGKEYTILYFISFLFTLSFILYVSIVQSLIDRRVQ